MRLINRDEHFEKGNGIMKKLFALGSIALAFAGVKADVQVEWSASAGSSALPDVVSVTYEGDAVKALTVSPQNSESVVFAGDAISFAPDAVISLTANGSIVFSNKVVSASGALSVSCGGALLSWEGEALPVTANPAEGRVIFTGVSIDDLSVASSDFCNAESGLTGFARPYFVSRSEGILECQLQSQKTAQYNAGTTQSAKLVLMQDGENIRASIAWAKTNGSTSGDYRGKLDFTEPVTVNQETLAEIDSPVVNNLTMVYTAAKQMGKVIFAGETEVETFKVEGGVKAVLDAESTQGDIASHVNVSADSMFVFKNAYGRTVTGALSGNGDVLFEEPIITNTVSTSKINVVAKSNNNKNPHRTRREPSNRLKIQVLMRDGNRCRLCGVECNDGLHNIHFDHIIPWSKGGETTLDNLQVLCSDCNLAKGDL
jgi:membrane-bound inhibitor of C-type lysozyme